MVYYIAVKVANHNHIDKSHKHSIEWKKLEYILYDSIYMKFKSMHN